MDVAEMEKQANGVRDLTPAEYAVILDKLKLAKVLIGNTWDWCQRSFARTGDGMAVEADDHRACCWCASGAMRKAFGEWFTRDNHPMFLELAELVRMASQDWLEDNGKSALHGGIVEVNDYHGFDAVHAVFDKVIENFDWYVMRAA